MGKDVILEAKNEVTLKYRVATDALREKDKNLKRGYLSELINQVKKKQKIEYVDIPLKTI